MADYDVLFYGLNPTGTFTQTIGGTTVYSGPAVATGTATITDNQAGIEGTTFDDDDATENATADVSINGLTSIGSTVDAEAVWTLRDTTTGEIFHMVSFDVEQGAAAGDYLLSERPLIVGRTYETVEYDSLPDAVNGDPVFSYLQQTGFNDEVVSGTAGDDVIDTSYTSDPDGDQIDNLDNFTETTSTDEILSWTAFGPAGTDVTGVQTQSLGGVTVGVTVTDDGALAASEVRTNDQYVGSDSYDPNSALYLQGAGGVGDTTTLTLDFSAEQGSGKASEVSGVNFRINEIDFGSWQDIITVTAIGPDGTASPVTITVDGNDSLAGNTVTGESTNDAANDQNSSIKIDIPGPVRQVIIDYDNGGTGGQVLNVTDIHFTTLNSTADNRDSVDAGAGNDFIDAGLDQDTVDGGTGSDTIVAGSGDDTLMGGDDADVVRLDDNFGTDQVAGGEGGLDNDTLDAGNLTAGVDVTFTGSEQGVLTDGTSTANFTEIEQFILTDQADSVAGGSTSGAIGVDAGGGNDTVQTGTGNDTIVAGTGDDLVQASGGADGVDAGSGADTVFGGGGSDTIYGQSGDDSIDGGGSADTLVGGAGADTISGGTGNDLISGDTEVLTLNTAGNDGAASVDNFTDMPTSAVSYEITFASTSQSSGVDPLLSYGVSGSTNELLFMMNGNNLELLTNDGNTVSIDVGASSLFDGSAHTLGFSWDSATGEVIFYVDGEAAGTGTGSAAPLTSGGTFMVGQDQDSLGGGFDPSQIFAGDVYQATLYGDVRTDQEMAFGTSLLVDETDPNLIANWVPDSTLGQMTDTVGTNDLTLQGDSAIAGVSAGDDVLDGGAGDDTILAGAGADQIGGGTGDDSITGGLGNDTILLEDGFGTDVVDGSADSGDGDVDVIDASALGSGITVTLSSTEAGTLTNGTNSVTFSEIEGLVFTDFDDVFDGAAATAPLTIDTGLGDDTITGGSGNDTLTGGGGNDTFVYVAGAGSDIIADFGSGETGPINDGDQSNNDFVDLSSFYTQAALNAYNAANGTLADLLTELALLREDAVDGTLDGIVNGVDISADTGPIDLTLLNGGSAVTGGALRFDNTNVICFAEGTRIETAAGARAVDSLRVGDLVKTKDHGLKPIRWIGSKTVLAVNELAPIVISEGVLGNSRALKVSPQHRMLISGALAKRLFGESEVLVPAKHLTDWPGISRSESGKVTYFHILFEEHEIVFAEGAASESFHPGSFGMSTLEVEAREEIYRLFPELRDQPTAFGPAARKSLNASEARHLAPMG